MKIYGLKTFLLVGFCFTSCLFISCKDDTNQLGAGLQNPDDQVLVFYDSSMQINSYTSQRLDSVQINPNYLLLGFQNDPHLGTFENSFMSEISYSKPIFEGTPVFDSLVFYLNYSLTGSKNTDYPTIYGDSLYSQSVNIYELKKDSTLELFGLDSLLQTDDIFGTYVEPTPIRNFSFTPKLTDTVIRIKLPIKLGERLLDTSLYDSDNTFYQHVLKGFYFKALPTEGTGAISAFTIYGETRLELYYHDEVDDSLSTTYFIKGENVRTNIFKRTLNPEITYLANGTIPTDESEQNNFYIKNNNALEAIVQISGLQSWADSGLFTINKAILTLETDLQSTEDSLFEPIKNLIVTQIIDNDSVTKVTNVTEYDLQSTSALIQYVDSVGYRININKTLYTAIEDGRDQLNLVFSTPTAFNQASPARTIFKGANHPEKPIKLHITYTKFNL